MATEKVLLMHGPTQLPYRPPFPELFYPYVPYDSRPAIGLMAQVFRRLGFKVAYSGWQEDGEWLEANRQLFDFIAVSDQHQLNTESAFFGKTIGNNKEKLYYASLRGLQAIRQGLGDDAVVYRLRGDVTVHQGHVAAHVARIARGSGDIMIEYSDVSNMYFTPDFMLTGEVAVLEAIYASLFARSAAGTSYHVSSHVDHTLTYLALQQAGVVGRIISMGREVHDSMVWRGIPRHFQEADPRLGASRSFSSEMRIHPSLTVEHLIAQIPAGATGGKLPPRAV